MCSTLKTNGFSVNLTFGLIVPDLGSSIFLLLRAFLGRALLIMSAWEESSSDRKQGHVVH